MTSEKLLAIIFEVLKTHNKRVKIFVYKDSPKINSCLSKILAENGKHPIRFTFQVVWLQTLEEKATDESPHCLYKGDGN
jgi:hypothetical protein